MRAVIVATKRLTAFEASGVTPLSDDMDGPGTLEDKSTNDKYKRGCSSLFPQGPVYIFEGKDVPTFVCRKENGSITSTLLAAMLKRIDDLVVFEEHGTGGGRVLVHHTERICGRLGIRHNRMEVSTLK
jgi:hypothetical protein